MNKTIIFIALFAFATSCCSVKPPEKSTVTLDFGFGEDVQDTAILQLKCFTYDQLYQTPLNYEKFDLKTDTIFTLNNEKYYFRKDEDYLVLSKSRSGDTKDVNILGTKYAIHSLYPVESDSALIIITNTCLIRLSNRNYLLFYVQLFPTNSVDRLSQGILIDMDHPHTLIRFPFLQYSDSPLCLNDFDHDGNLDYARLDIHKDKITCYHLQGDQFVLDKDHYIELDGCIDKFYSINPVNSKWFFKLDNYARTTLHI